MTRIFDNDGLAVPVTVIEAGPCFVVQIKTAAKDGYEALQVGFDRRALAKCNKPEKGHFEKHGAKSGFKCLREFRVDEAIGFEAGQEITVEQFEIGDRVDVIGTSKGKGFAGQPSSGGTSTGVPWVTVPCPTGRPGPSAAAPTPPGWSEARRCRARWGMPGLL